MPLWPYRKHNTLYESKQTTNTGAEQEKRSLPLCLLDAQDLFLCLFIWHKHHRVTKEHKAWGIFSKTHCNSPPC